MVEVGAPRTPPPALSSRILPALLAPSSTLGKSAARWRGTLLVVLTAAALGVGLFGIGRPDPWVDESVTVLVVRRPWSGILALLQGADAPLVPYYLLAKAWAGLLPWLSTLVAVRTLSAVAAAVTVAALFTLVARMNGMLTGAVAAVMLTSLAGFSRYAQEARPYSLLVMTSTLAWLGWQSWRRPEPGALRKPSGWRHELWRASGYLLSLAASVAFHLFGLFQWPAQVLADLVAERGSWRDRTRRALATCAAMVCAAVVVGIPMLFAATRGTGAPRLVKMTLAQLTSDFFTTLSAKSVERPVLPLLGLVVLAVLAVAFRLHGARRFRRLVIVALVWAVIPLALSIGAAALRPALLRSRYWMPIVVPISALAAVGLIAGAGFVWRLVAGRAPTAGRTRAAAIAAALVIGLFLAGHAALQVPQHRAIRASSGHNMSVAPALAQIDEVLQNSPDMPLTTTPSTRTTVVWATRPDLVERDVLFTLDQNAPSVWPPARDAAEVARLLEGHQSVLWVRARIAAAGTVPTPKPTLPPKALQALGFSVVVAERHGSWWVCLLER